MVKQPQNKLGQQIKEQAGSRADLLSRTPLYCVWSTPGDVHVNHDEMFIDITAWVM